MPYTNIDDPSAYFQTTTYAGAGGSQTVTNDGNSDLQPDLVYVKNRSSISEPTFIDTTRGGNKFLYTATFGTSAEESASGNGIASFNTDGITWDTVASTYFNSSGNNFVAWQWKANGGSTSSNTDGGITTTVQANTDAGFSIVSYTGDGATSQTVGHGLGAVPKMIISKDRDSTSNVPTWRVYHEAIGATKYLTLNATDAAATFDDWGNTTPTSSVYTIGGSGGYRPTNTNNTEYIAYVFAEKQGYSKFGKYKGNGVGTGDGPFVYLGFKPAFLLLKNITNANNWRILDNKRLGYNPNNYRLSANANSSESTTEIWADLLSNGFKLRTNEGSVNAANTDYIYMAFAENPFTTSTGIPTTAR
jgi:hypothetical protein